MNRVHVHVVTCSHCRHFLLLRVQHSIVARISSFLKVAGPPSGAHLARRPLLPCLRYCVSCFSQPPRADVVLNCNYYFIVRVPLLLPLPLLSSPVHPQLPWSLFPSISIIRGTFGFYWFLCKNPNLLFRCLIACSDPFPRFVAFQWG